MYKKFDQGKRVENQHTQWKNWSDKNGEFATRII